VHHNPSIGQAVTHAGRSGCQQQRTHAARLTNAPGADGRFYVLHGVINSQAGSDGTA